MNNMLLRWPWAVQKKLVKQVLKMKVGYRDDSVPKTGVIQEGTAR